MLIRDKNDGWQAETVDWQYLTKYWPHPVNIQTFVKGYSSKLQPTHGIQLETERVSSVVTADKPIRQSPWSISLNAFSMICAGLGYSAESLWLFATMSGKLGSVGSPYSSTTIYFVLFFLGDIMP